VIPHESRVFGVYQAINLKISNDIDLKSIVPMQVCDGGNVPLNHCQKPDAVSHPAHKDVSSCIQFSKRKPDSTINVKFTCTGAHHNNFRPIEVYLTGKSNKSQNKIDSDTFILTGSRDKSRVKGVSYYLEQVSHIAVASTLATRLEDDIPTAHNVQNSNILTTSPPEIQNQTTDPRAPDPPLETQLRVSRSALLLLCR